MRVFIDFWKLETKNSILHVFSFLHKLSFENSFCFLLVLSCQSNFLVSKIENCFWKQKTRGKNSYQTYPNFLNFAWASLKQDSWIFIFFSWAGFSSDLSVFYHPAWVTLHLAQASFLGCTSSNIFAIFSL